MFAKTFPKSSKNPIVITFHEVASATRRNLANWSVHGGLNSMYQSVVGDIGKYRICEICLAGFGFQVDRNYQQLVFQAHVY